MLAAPDLDEGLEQASVSAPARDEGLDSGLLRLQPEARLALPAWLVTPGYERDPQPSRPGPS